MTEITRRQAFGPIAMVGTSLAVPGATEFSHASSAADISGKAYDKPFAVDNGDGTVTVYFDNSGSAVIPRTLATTTALASMESGKGLDLVGRPTVEEMLTSSAPPRGQGSRWHAAQFSYIEADSSAVDQHVTTAGGVKLYVEGNITPNALGAPCDGIGDDAPFFEKAFQIGPTLNLMPGSTYRLASLVGLPDVDSGQSLSSDQSLVLNAIGARILCASPLIEGVPEAIFTSATAKLDPDTVTNAYTGKFYVFGGNWNDPDWKETFGSVLFNGDRLYQIVLFGGTYNKINRVVKSFRQKTHDGFDYPEGYLQSLQITNCQFSAVQRIVDAKRAFNVFINNNYCTGCIGGVYIDSITADAAVAVMSFKDNLFQGGGCALVLGKVLSLDYSGGYLESNYSFDAFTQKCDVWLKEGPSPSTGVTISGVGCQPHPDQIADPYYATFRIDYTPVPPISPPAELSYCYTTGGNLVTRGKAILNACGSNVESTLRSAVSPYSPQSAKRSTISGTRTYLAATNLVGDVFRVASIDTSDMMDLLAVNQRPVKGEINILIQHKGAGAVVSGTTHLVIGFVFMPASEGVAHADKVDALYGTFVLKDFMEIAPGQPIDTLGAVTARHFASPVLTMTRTGSTGPFDLFLSGYAAASLPNYGADDRITSHITIEADALNESSILASPIAIAGS